MVWRLRGQVMAALYDFLFIPKVEHGWVPFMVRIHITLACETISCYDTAINALVDDKMLSHGF